MLTTLRIKNLALVSDLTLELQPGYNAVTGETGAGKSIIIGALNLVLGERADRALIRNGAESCAVEAAFDVTRLRAPFPDFLATNGLEPCEGGHLILKRSFSQTGTNRQFVNGSPTTLNILAQIGEWLVDMHGPHDHQSLLHPARQLAILDAFGGLEPAREAFADLVRKRTQLEAEKSELIVDERTYTQQLELLRFQVQEIAGAELQADEEQTLLEQHGRASNAAKLLQLTQAALEVLGEGDGALLTQAGVLGRTLQELQRVDPGAASLIELHSQSVAAWNQLQSELSRYADKVELDPERMAELEERLNLIQTLKRKYGNQLSEIIAFGNDAARKLELLESRDAEIARLNAALARLDSELIGAGRSLTATRRNVIPPLAKAARRQLTDLGFNQCSFDISLTTAAPTPGSQFNASGFDAVEFQFTPNPGEPAKPLRTIASSGEMARVMLALKTVLAVQDEIPVLVFDEVDANIGGETATVVGEKMKQIAAKRQVICITHLPQVAAAADAHCVVSKHLRDGRTISELEWLDKKSRVTELARMLGGQTEESRRHAQALLR